MANRPRPRSNRPRARVARKPAVLLPVLIQDPSVAADVSRVVSLTHPVIVKDPKGFTEGPACRRVAVVDFNFHTGRIGAPARFDPRVAIYRGVAAYRASMPTRKGARVAPWSRAHRTVPLARLGSSRYNDPFLKVSVFGIVLRTIGLIQDRVALGREVRWAFPGEQLLIVPRAGALENAFYHRESRSLQFYYGALSGRAARAIYSALSQDIVAHETTHAIVDGIAPDLYDALSPESLAIHEGLADITAALLSMRNLELLPQKKRDTPKALLELQGSSRFTRIAEEFGKWQGYGEALRDVCNAKTLNPAEPDASRRVDSSSPHSVSEVLSGALFEVLRNELAVLPHDPELVRALRGGGFPVSDQRRWQTTYAVNRLLSLIYKGLDWLPPGEASLGELIRAMVVADEIYLPKETTARGVLVREALHRRILREVPPQNATLGLAEGNFGNPFELLRSSARARRGFVERHREAFGIAPGTPVHVVCRLCDVYEPQLVPPHQGESFFLSPPFKRHERVGRSKHLVLKLRWMCTEPNNLGSAWGRARRFKSGATVVFDQQGRARAVLRAGADLRQIAGRTSFLKRLLLNDTDGGRRIGPDGLPLESAMRTRLRSDTLSVSGTFQALHIAGDET
jgi:hypothetical protein